MNGIKRIVQAAWNRNWLVGLALVTATVLAYQPVWHAGFIWDDDSYVTDNPALHSLHGLRQIWFEPGATAQYYPLTFTVFWVEYHLWGLQPLGYHLVNVLLHAFNAVLFWLILRGLRIRGAWLAAGFFALHPVCVESVAWITECKNTLSGFFFLTAILTGLNFWLPNGEFPNTTDSTHKTGNWKYYFPALVFYLCALGSKTATIPLPVVFLLLVWWKRGRPGWREVWPILPFLAAGFGMGLVTMHVEKHIGATGSGWEFAFGERCLLASRVIWFYLGKLIWPCPLIFVYPRWQIDVSKPLAYLPMVVGGAALLLLWWKRRGWARPVLFTFAYYLVLIFPVLGFFNIFYFRYSFVSDHFQYLASLGPIALAAAGVVSLSNYFQTKSFLGSLPGGMLLLALGILTWRQCAMYADAETLWRTTIARNPNAYLAHDNLGSIFFQKGRMDEAFDQFQKALAIQPDYAQVNYNLATLFVQKGQVEKAIACFQKALAIKPNYTEAHYNFANVLLGRGRVDEAIVHYRKALEIRPDFAEAHNNLGNALLQMGHADEAIAHYRQALELRPDYPSAHNNLGNVLFQKRETDEAIVQYQRAIESDPRYAEPHYNLGVVFESQGQKETAIEQYGKAIRINPGYADARCSLANLLLALGRLDEAVEQYQKALQLDATLIEPRFNLGMVLAHEGRLDEAVENFKEVIRLKPDYAAAHGNLADVLAGQDKWGHAIGEYQQALALAPDLAQAHFKLGLALEKQKQFAAAAKQFQETLRLDPNHEGAKQQLHTLEAAIPNRFP